jgi:magnesium transporter
MWKEIRIAMLCGACVFAACFIKTWAYDCKFNTEPQYLMIAAAVSATVFVAIVLAKLIGAILPIGAKVIKLDPSVMASPFITTIVDTLTLLVYFLIVIYLLVPQMTAVL